MATYSSTKHQYYQYLPLLGATKPPLGGFLLIFLLCSVALVARAVNLQIMDTEFLQEQGEARFLPLEIWPIRYAEKHTTGSEWGQTVVETFVGAYPKCDMN